MVRVQFPGRLDIVMDFEMLTTGSDKPHTVCGEVGARHDAGNLAAVNNRLIEEAVKLGGNGIINLTYERKATWNTWPDEALIGRGTAVKFEAVSQVEQTGRVNLVVELERLGELHRMGTLSDEEFGLAKSKLLADD